MTYDETSDPSNVGNLPGEMQGLRHCSARGLAFAGSCPRQLVYVFATLPRSAGVGERDVEALGPVLR